MPTHFCHSGCLCDFPLRFLYSFFGGHGRTCHRYQFACHGASSGKRVDLTFIIEFLGLGMIYIALFFPVLFKMGAERGRIFLMAMYMIPFCIILFLEQNKMMPNLSALPFSFQYVKIGAGI